jgi:flagellar P-ring protein precursor FlgI
MKTTLHAVIIMMAASAFGQAKQEGPSVRIKDIARVRGVRYNQLSNVGIVVGLEGTGDTRNSPFAQQAIINMVKEYGIAPDPRALNLRNVALVMVTAELPPFARNGSRIDVTVSSIGDAKSLQGGYLLQTPLYAPAAKGQAFAVAMGPVSIGGFNFGQGGTSRQKNHTNVGVITDGAMVERAVQMDFALGGSLFLELSDPDFTTAERMAAVIAKARPELSIAATDAGGVEIRDPSGAIADPVGLLSSIESLSVVPDTQAVIVINERTGTIVVGGNVKIGPALIAQGGLTVKINEFNEVVQPLPFSKGTTENQKNTDVKVKEDTVNIGIVKPNATIDDLAKVFRALKLSPRDMIAIIEALKAQGAIKATVKTQ